MGLSREEIVDLASRYVSAEEITDFTCEGDVFSLLIRELPQDKVLSDEEGWGFGGYGLCLGYTVDHEAKPAGKWLWMHFASLQSFPPSPQVIRLQPPHVVKGRFQNPERTQEIRILKIDFSKASLESAAAQEQQIAPEEKPAKEENGKIVKFRKKGATKES